MYLDQMASVDGYRFGDQNNGVGGWGFSKYGANVGWSTSRKHAVTATLPEPESGEIYEQISKY